MTKVARARTIANLWRDAVAAAHPDPAYLQEVDGDWREVTWAESAQAELRASGETVRRVHDHSASLSPQELQIAMMAAQGLTNRDIASQLFLSPRTVSTHLYRIYPKLGVSTRTELHRVLADQPTNDPRLGG